MKTGVLLVNLGTPASPETKAVRRYLREFLMDGRVIDIPLIPRWLLVNFLIAPFRAPRSSAAYKKLWMENGSPLMIYGTSLAHKLQKKLGDEYVVRLAMRYQSPSIRDELDFLYREKICQLILLPLFPQYASATTGSIIEKVMTEIKGWQNFPGIRIIDAFYNHPLFIKAVAGLGKQYMQNNSWDHILFSYHGLPERQILKASNGICYLGDCCNTICESNFKCYRAQCFETSRLLASELDIPEDKYSVVFQSRLGKDPWIQPYAEDVIKELPAKGLKNVLIFCPSFVADCLETTLEAGEEFKKLFQNSGGSRWQLVEGLNDSDEFIEILLGLIHTLSYDNLLEN